MAYPAFLARLKNNLRDFLLGITSPDPAGVDAEMNQILEQVNAINLRLRAITDPDGNLRNLAVATAQALCGAQRFSATAAQTVFVTSIPWRSSFTALNVFVTSGGVMVDTSLVTPADNGSGFLQVTVPAQSLSAVVLVAAFESGAGILTRLQSQDTGEGATLVAIEDAGGNFTGATVETALSELADLITALDSTLTTLNANAILKNGTVTFTANQPMGGFKITGLGAGTASSNDAARMADITQAALVSILGSYFSSTFLALSGGTMTGAINMGNNPITSMDDGVNAQDAVTKAQLDTKLNLAGGTMTGPIDMGGDTVTGLPTAVADSDAVPLSQARTLAAPFATLAVYQVAGTTPFVVPAGVTKIRVQVFGGGGGGSTHGGAGGAFATAILPVTPAETLTLTIGAAGVGGGTPTAGGLSKIARTATDLVTANGGAAGSVASPAGGTYAFDGSVTGFGINGQGGGATWTDNDGTGHIGGGTGGSCPRGGGGGKGRDSGSGGGGSAAQAGAAPGGGGGGDRDTPSSGGSGGVGSIVIEY